MNESKRNRGITLIALIVTIIVLLILAGISIAMLTGENGILTQASKAKTVTTKTEVDEQIKLAVMAAKTNVDGTVVLSVLEDELERIGTIGTDIIIEKQGTDGNLPWKVTTKAGVHQITEEGQVCALENELVTAQQIAENPKKYYGKKVENYKASESDTNTYRIFYVDATGEEFGDEQFTIYLKADPSGSYYLDTTYDETNTKVRAMNPIWSLNRGESEASWFDNEKVAAYLCSPVNSSNFDDDEVVFPWNCYYMNSESVNYVIGGPSVEMFVNSYNQYTGGKLNGEDYILGTYFGSEGNTFRVLLFRFFIKVQSCHQWGYVYRRAFRRSCLWYK